MEVPSKSQVKKAGSTLRKSMRGDLGEGAAVAHALRVMESWRRAHYVPLLSANNGLRSRARTASVAAEVTQRLKRRQTILDKLRREPTLDLSRMQDIGGCRAVVAALDDLRRLEARIRQRLAVISYADYTLEPRVSGYRGVHIVVPYQERAMEIQLRTNSMHAWALAAEHSSTVIGQNLKQDGTHPIQLFLAVAADMMALQVEDRPIPEEMAMLHEQRRLEARRSLEGGTS